MQTLPRGFHKLEAGDNVESEAGVWGSVHPVGDELVILWRGGSWVSAEEFGEYATKWNEPYRIQRSES